MSATVPPPPPRLGFGALSAAGFGFAVLAGGLLAAPAASYHVTAHYALSAETECGGLALDPANRRLYAAQGSRIEILQADSGSKLGAISPAPGIRAIELAPGLGRGFTANGGDDSMTEFDLKTGAVVRTMKSAGRGPVSLTYDPEAGRVFLVDRESADLTVIDPGSGEVTGSVTLGGKPEAIVSNGYGRLFVSDSDRNVLHVVDTHTLALLGDDPVDPGVGPGGMGMDPAGRRVFVACRNGKMPIVDADAGFVFQVLPIGSGAGEAVFDRSKEPNPDGGPPWKGRIIAASADGTLSILRMNAFISYTFHDRIAIPAGARGLAFDAGTDRVLVALPHEILVLGR